MEALGEIWDYTGLELEGRVTAINTAQINYA